MRPRKSAPGKGANDAKTQQGGQTPGRWNPTARSPMPKKRTVENPLMPIIKNRHPPMRKLTQPWKLCRSFGSRPVGSVVGPRWTEAGITAEQIPSLPSRRTFRGKGDSHCRPADWGVGDTRGADSRTLFRPKFSCFLYLHQGGGVFASGRASRTCQAFLVPSNNNASSSVS